MIKNILNILNIFKKKINKMDNINIQSKKEYIKLSSNFTNYLKKYIRIYYIII